MVDVISAKLRVCVVELAVSDECKLCNFGHV
jgi:hypothetical protein